MYLIFGIFSGLIGLSFSLIMRGELASYGPQYIISPNYNQIYNVIITAHGIIMIFFFVMPILIGAFGNFLTPILIGAADTAFPRINNFAFWLLIPSILLLLISSLIDGGVGTGWTLYPPLSNVIFHGTPGVDIAILAIHLTGLSSLLGSINFITTIINLRVHQFKLIDAPLYVWAILITSILLLFSLPILAAGITLLLTDRNFNTSFYEVSSGGDPLIFQHLFWLFGHPEVYIIIIPVFGIISHIVSYYSNRIIFGKLGMIYAIASIAILGFAVWAHHQYTIGMDIDSRAYFSGATMVIAVPTGIKIWSWLATLFGGRLKLSNFLFWLELYLFYRFYYFIFFSFVIFNNCILTTK